MALTNDAGLSVITEGCKTSHGGYVLPISRPFKVGEHSVALVGDMTHCPKCRGDFPIAEGDPNRNWHDKPMAFHGHKTACGAILISELAPPPLVELVQAIRNGIAHDEQFLLKGEDGQPIPEMPYKATVNGVVIAQGVTDADGKTQRIFTLDPQGVTVEPDLDTFSEE
jgi:uncharacterized Zn-binding protein involved in type VI secretion